MRLTRKVGVTMMALAMTAMSAMTAFAAGYSVEMYGIGSDGVAKYSTHTENMVKSVEKNGDTYKIVFQPTDVTMGSTTITGYISELTANGYEGELDDNNCLTISYEADDETFEAVKNGETVTKSGTAITYKIQTGSFAHPNSAGYLVVIEE